MKRAVGFLAALVLTVSLVRPCWGVELTLTSHAALLMEKSTGEILYAQNEHDALPPASVTGRTGSGSSGWISASV